MATDIEAVPGSKFPEDKVPVSKTAHGTTSSSQLSVAQVGRENLGEALPPHESYEGRHRFDPTATWTPEEEKRVIRKTDLYLLSWICVMASCGLLNTYNVPFANDGAVLWPSTRPR